MGVSTRTRSAAWAAVRAHLRIPDAKYVDMSLASSLFFLVVAVTTASRPAQSPEDPGPTILIEVRDAEGQPVSGVPVRARATFVPAVGALPGWKDRRPPALSRTDTLGLARFARASEWIQTGAETRLWVEFDFPLAVERVLDFEFSAWPGKPIAIVLPATGRVRVPLPRRPGARARLFVAAKPGESSREREGTEAGARWVSSEDGHADFLFVGLGFELEYQVDWHGLDTLLVGRAPGPMRAGEMAVLPALDKEALPRLIGRLLDEEGQPLAGSDVVGRTTCRTLAGGSRAGEAGASFRLTTDVAGRFGVDYATPYAARERRVLTLVPAIADELPWDMRSTVPQAFVDLSRELPSGPIDLGDVVLVAPASPRRWARFDEAELEQEFDRLSESCSAGLHRHGELESLLAQAGRRGGMQLRAFLERLTTKWSDRRVSFQDHPGEQLLPVAQRALVVASGRAEPLTIEVLGAPRIECALPDYPSIVWSLHNRDPAASVRLAQGGDYRTGRFTRVRFDVQREDGTVVPPLPDQGGFGGGMFNYVDLRPYERWVFSSQLRQYAPALLPGRYRVRVQYHDSESIASYRDVRPLAVVESAEFELLVYPRRVRVADEERQALEKDIGSIDISQPVRLARTHWRPDEYATTAKSKPEDRLYAAGWRALPVLLDALADPTVERARADWIMGLCYSISGLNKPGHFSELGSYEWHDHWSGSNDEPAQVFPLFEHGQGHGGQDAEARREYIDRWLALRPGFVVER